MRVYGRGGRWLDAVGRGRVRVRQRSDTCGDGDGIAACTSLMIHILHCLLVGVVASLDFMHAFG